MRNLRFGYFVLALAAILLVFGTGCRPRRTTVDGMTRIVVADARTTHHLNLYVAYELGIFARYGLAVEIIEVEDLAAARDFVVSGGADVFWSCPTVAIAAIGNGAPIRTIAQVKTPCTSVLLVPPGSPINTLEDLHGRSIAGIGPVCEAVLSLTVAARAVGAAFNLQNMGGGPAIMALQAGAVDGAILEEPHASIAELAGFERRFAEISESIPCRTINVSNRFLANNVDALKYMIRAVDEANEIILANPIAENLVEIAVRYTGAPEASVIHGNHLLVFGTRIEVEGLLALTDELVLTGDIPENPGTRMFAEEFRGITW